jgi:hypothetical protein
MTSNRTISNTFFASRKEYITPANTTSIPRTRS